MAAHCPVLTADAAMSTAETLAAEFAVGAAGRDSARELPRREVERLSASGLLAITVPREYGGADLPPSVVAEVIRILQNGDWRGFGGLLGEAGTREELVLTFLALLELVRTGRISLVQTEAFGEIRVKAA